MTNILIPCAGSGQRFKDAGYEMPKPLIPVAGKPLIQRVVESLQLDGTYIFAVLEEHERDWGLASFLQKIKPDCKIVFVKEKTGGAVNTCLLAESHIDNDMPLVISNCDQICSFNAERFAAYINQYDGCTVYFRDTHPKWSFIQLDNDNFLTCVKEKFPISDKANVGVYGYNKGKDFVRFAKQMMQDETKKVNHEFYIAPVYNEFIQDGLKVVGLECQEMLPCGVPEDLIQTEHLIKMNDWSP